MQHNLNHWPASEYQFMHQVRTYDGMMRILRDTPYPATGDYSHMTAAQAKGIQRLEKAFERDRALREAAVEEIKRKLTARFPERRLTFEFSQVVFNHHTFDVLKNWTE